MFASAATPPGRRRGLLALAGLTLAITAVGGGSYLYSTRSRPDHAVFPGGAVSPDTAAAHARVHELEVRVAALEREKAALEAALAAGSALPSVLTGELVDPRDPDIVPPTLLGEGSPARHPDADRGPQRRALVVVEALVSEDGRVLEARALESSVVGMGFEEAAERRVEASSYRPATRNGSPLRVRMRVPVEFVP